MSVLELPQNGNFMPAEFWYWSTIAIGFCFISLAGFIIKNFLVKLDLTLRTMSQNIMQLTENLKKIEVTLEKQEEMLAQHEKQLNRRK